MCSKVPDMESPFPPIARRTAQAAPYTPLKEPRKFAHRDGLFCVLSKYPGSEPAFFFEEPPAATTLLNALDLTASMAP